jgi:queuine tRNA-ribosyltransferase
MKALKTLHGNLKLPAFFPDATYGHVIGTSVKDLENCKIDGVVVNTYHLLKHKLIEEIKRAGGIHKFMKFSKPIISDSGGFQVMSLIHNHPELGKIKENEIIFNLDSKKIILTPEKCIRLQLKIGADIIMCLDDCTKADISLQEQKASVSRTIGWARKCKKEFERLTKDMKKKPLLFAIVQGGEIKKLRKYCTQELLKIGFDGYSFGGWPIKEGKLLKETLKYVSTLLPADKPKYAMGIGKPQDILECVKLGYNIFDCVLPTRDARHKRLYVFKSKPGKNLQKSFGTINLRGKYLNEKLPVSKFCGCECCKKYSLSQLYTFFKTKNKQSIRLATVHNLSFYSQLMELLRPK